MINPSILEYLIKAGERYDKTCLTFQTLFGKIEKMYDTNISNGKIYIFKAK